MLNFHLKIIIKIIAKKQKKNGSLENLGIAIMAINFAKIQIN